MLSFTSIISLLIFICAAQPADATPATMMEPILPIPKNMPVDPEKVALGAKLFQDRGISKGKKYSCTTCHQSKHAGTDGQTLPDLVDGKGARNVPTIFNTGFNLAQVWDGRFATIADDVHATFTNIRSFNTTWPEVLNYLNRDSSYAPFRQRQKRGKFTRYDVTSAISTYVLSLTTPNSRFDQYLRGQPEVLTTSEKKGYILFKSYGCTACHQGVNIGGNMYQKFGIIGNYFKDRGQTNPGDLGRYNVTKRDEDRFVFKVPGLRLVTLTAPYFHDGSVADLDDAIKIMGVYQLGQEIPGDDIKLIKLFLGTIHGEYEGKPF